MIFNYCFSFSIIISHLANVFITAKFIGNEVPFDDL